MEQSDFANIPVKSGTGNYLGNPKTDLSLVLILQVILLVNLVFCNIVTTMQQEPIFDPSNSTTYSVINCTSSLCTQLLSPTGNQGCANFTQTCIYGIQYADNSLSHGYLSNERLIIASGDTSDNFLFGCGQDNQGENFGGADGILGLGRHPFSFVQQTSSIYNKVFSYCLPSTASSVGHLTYGKDGTSNNVQYTPISTVAMYPSFYGITITRITVGGTELSWVASTLSSTRAIIDSGTIITGLPPSVYGGLKSEFQQKMSMYPKASELSILDTCYDLSGYETVKVSEISLVFGGGVKLDLDASGIVFVMSEKQVCLAFAANESDEDLLILGNVQQKTIEVVYDLNAERLGFGHPGGCN